MKLMIKQRVFSWGDTYDIYDEFGNAKYLVKAKVFSFGHQLRVFDMNGNEIGEIHESILALTPRFKIILDGQVYGTIRKKFTLFTPKYDIDFNGWYVEGDFIGWNYNVYESGRPIIHISKELFKWGDTYVIDFENPRDELMGMLLIIAIDAANCSGNKLINK